MDVENKFMVTKGEIKGKDKPGDIGIDIYTLLCIKQMTNKNLLYSTGNSTQCSVLTSMGKEAKKRVDLCIYVTNSLCGTAATNATL